MLHRPCILAFWGIPTAKRGEKKISRGPQQKGINSERASPLPSPWSKSGQKCYVTPAFSKSPTPSAASKKAVVVPNKGDQNQK